MSLSADTPNTKEGQSECTDQPQPCVIMVGDGLMQQIPPDRSVERLATDFSHDPESGADLWPWHAELRELDHSSDMTCFHTFLHFPVLHQSPRPPPAPGMSHDF